MTRAIGDFRNSKLMGDVYLRAMTTLIYGAVRRQVSTLSSTFPLNTPRNLCSLRGGGTGTTSRTSDLYLAALRQDQLTSPASFPLMLASF